MARAPQQTEPHPTCGLAGTLCNGGCMCQDCFNKAENEAFIKAEQSRIRSRNPEAFRGKVGS